VPRVRTFQIDRGSVSTCLCFIYVSGACARRINSNRACFLTVSAVSYTLCCAGPVGVGAVPTGLNRSAGARCRVLRGLRSVSHLRRCAVLRRRDALYLYNRSEPVGRARCTCTNRPEPVGRALPALPLVSGCTVAQRGRTAATTDFVCRVRCVVLDGGKSTQLLTTFTCTAGDAICMCAPPVSPSFRILLTGARGGRTGIREPGTPRVPAPFMLYSAHQWSHGVSAPTHHHHSSQCAPLHTPLLLSHMHRSVFTGNPHLCDA
jgi:hypothetical protein